MDNSIPIYGKTYSLFGEGSDTQGFYRRISALVDELLPGFDGSRERFLEYLRREGGDRKRLSRIAGGKAENPTLAFILHRCREILSEFLGDIEAHTRSVGPYRRLADRQLLTGREQYYLYMLEIEIINRMYIERFRDAAFRIALLPYCLKEKHDGCKATRDEFDYRCRNCVKTCFINRTARILEEKNIHPYILSQGRVRDLLAALHAKYGSIGVFGIACLVELVWGMRLCTDAAVPVVGIPLNANRCPRWMGRMHDTSVDITAIGRLLGE